MSNRAFLFAAANATENVSTEPESAMLGANYSLPLLWLSLFAENDIVHWRLDPDELDLDEDNESELSEEDLKVTGLVTTTAAALENTTLRLEQWKKRWPTQLDQIEQSWLNYIRSLTTPAIGVWAIELIDMVGTDEFNELLRTMITSLDGEHTDFDTTLAQSFLEESEGRLDSTANETSNLAVELAGYGWENDAPWENN